MSLPEILVGLAIMALLAAVVLPTVAGQILKGDATRVIEDLEAVRSGIEQFVADIHRYPGKYNDLSTPITTTVAQYSDIFGNAYTAGMVPKWKGPYVTKDTVTTSGVTNSVAPTGFGASLLRPFMRVTNTNGVEYVTIIATPISGPDFDKVDERFDGVINRTGGQLRWVSPDTLKFLALPIQ